MTYGGGPKVQHIVNDGSSGTAATIADGADVAEGAVADAVVAAGAAGTVSAKLRRLTTDLDANKTSVASIDTKTPAVGQTTKSASSPVVLASDDDIQAKLGIVTETAPATDTASSGLNGRLQRIAQRLTTLLAVFPTTIDTNSGAKSASTLRVVLATDQPALTAKLLVTPDSVALPANQSVNVAQINGVTTLMGNGVTGTGSQRVTVASDNTPFPVKTDQTTHGTTDLVAADLTKVAGTAVVNGGTAGSQSVGGMVANNGTINSAVNPILVGGQAVSSENAAGTTAKLGQFVTDLVGKQIVLPYANPENFVSGAITSAMTGTTTTSLIAAPAAGLRNYITQITVSNSHATVGTDIIIQDGSGGTTLYTIPAAAAYGGATITFPTPLRQPTTATAIFCANVTTGSNTKVSASGYKGA